MDIISNDIKRIENSIAKYIFKKYIMSKPISNKQINNRDSSSNSNSNNDSNNDSNSDNGIKDVILDETNINVSNKFNNKLYKLYCQQIFDLERHSFRILQDDVIKEDLKQMTIADKAYDINPKEYNINNNDILPDVLRCTYIRKYKNRYYRCKNKVINDDYDVCKKHENTENIYIDKYNQLLEQYEQHN
jgi:hypothetical protein